MVLGKFLDPKNDVAFKRVFGREKNKDILIHFLNDMIDFRGGSPITEISFLQTVQDPEIAAKKQSIVDVLCKDAKGDQYIVEMQVAKTDGFEKRAQYYAAKAYTSQLNSGEEYHLLKEIIFLAIVGFVMFPDKAAYKSDHEVLDRVTHDKDLKDFSFTFLELPKFKKSLSELSTSVEKWTYFFKYAQEVRDKDLDQLSGTDLFIRKAYEELDRHYWTQEELDSYERSVKEERDAKAILRASFKDGIAQGKAEGKIEGLIQVATQLLARGISPEEVASITTLDLATIRAIETKVLSP